MKPTQANVCSVVGRITASFLFVTGLIACGSGMTSGADGNPNGADAAPHGDGSLADAPGAPPDATVPSGDVLYVDVNIGSAMCTTYDPDTRACGAGADIAYRNLNAASGAAQPGDHVWVRQAVFTERFIPQRSGQANAPITFQAYPGETATITLAGGSFVPGIELTDRDWLVLHGIDVDNAMMWAQVLRSTHNVFKSSRYTVARDYGSRGGFRLVDSSYNQLIENTFEDGNDNLYLEHSDHNLVEGNTLRQARHTLLVIACSSYNIVRANTLDNPDQKGGETFDCEGVIESLYDDTPQVRRMDATQRNVWENNRFIGTRASGNLYDYNAIQFAGQRGIVRGNLFYDNLGGALGVQVYSDEALYNYENHMYHNTMYANHCFGVWTSSSSRSTYYGNELLNNIAWDNLDCGGSPGANIINDNPSVNHEAGNFTGNPMFVNAGARNLALAPGSPAVDAGVFLTRTTGAGSGTTLTVEDAGFFRDGYGIPGVVGDLIQLDGQTQTARITAIDEANSRLTLDRSLSWTAGQGVSLAFTGSAPDVGALER